jgi:hypothetical protein
MPVRFNGQSLIPAPLVEVQENFVVLTDTRYKRSEYVFTLNGTIVNIDTSLDSPGATGSTGMLGILAEQKRIRDLFNPPSGVALLEIEAPDGATNAYKTYAKVDSITFPPGVWVNRCEYSIILRANVLTSDTSYNELDNLSDTWNVSENDDGTYTISHQVQAKGLLIANQSGGYNDPLLAAKQWVASRGYTTTTAGVLTENVVGSGVLNFGSMIYPLASGRYWNRSYNESVDHENFTWSLSENFIFASGTTREEYSVTVTYDNNAIARSTIAVNGSVYGFADKSSNFSLKYNNAKGVYYSSVEPNIYLRAIPSIPSGYTLNPIPISRQVTHEVNTGVIRYGFTFLASSGSTIIPNAINESISINDSGPTDVFAQIQVPGRAKGPVVQHMKTYTLPERTVNISATIIPSGNPVGISNLLANYLAKPDTSAIVNALKPSAGYYYVKQDTEEFNPINKQYGRVVSWTIDNYASGIAGIPSGIRNHRP